MEWFLTFPYNYNKMQHFAGLCFAFPAFILAASLPEWEH
jgi:hypothetical protein